jgi:hypothetical protein
MQHIIQIFFWLLDQLATFYQLINLKQGLFLRFEVLALVTKDCQHHVFW